MNKLVAAIACCFLPLLAHSQATDTSPDNWTYFERFPRGPVRDFPLDGTNRGDFAREAFPPLFPLAVWIQNPPNAAEFKQMGVRYFFDLWQIGRPLEPQLTTLEGLDMSAMVRINGPAIALRERKGISGWIQMDEPDRVQFDGVGITGCPDPRELQERYRIMKEIDASRPVFLSFSQGVGDDLAPLRGTCTGHNELYPELAKAADVLLAGIFPSSTTSPLRGHYETIATAVDRMRTYVNQQKPVWMQAEVVSLAGFPKPSANQVKLAMWLPIIHGAQGLVLFATDPGVSERTLLDDPNQKARVQSVINEIRDWNQPIMGRRFIQPGWIFAETFSAAERVDCTAWQTANVGWWVACANPLQNSAANVKIHCCGNATFAVVNENRFANAVAGTITDTFAPQTVHLYKQVPDGTPPPPPPPPPPPAGSIDVFAVFSRDCIATACYDGDAGDGAGSYQNSPLRWAASFNVPTLPAGATLTGAELQLEAPNATLVDNADLKLGAWNGNLQSDPGGTTAAQQSAACNLAAPYMTATNVGGTTGLKTITLPAAFLTDATAAITAATRMTLCLQSTNEAPAASRMVWFSSETQTNKPRLRLFYSTGQAQAQRPTSFVAELVH